MGSYLLHYCGYRKALIKFVYLIGSSALFIPNILFAENLNKADNLSLKYDYGTMYLLPSLVKNSLLEYDDSKNYSDIWISGYKTINHFLSYSGSLEISNLPHNIIGTKYSRPDYLFSTGRIQESYLNIKTDNLNMMLGRANSFFDPLRPSVFVQPVSGDGLIWSYSSHQWTFKHVVQTFPAEKSGDLIFRRVFNYHHLTYEIGDLTLGAGEYLILTGENIGLDLKRFNPFVPYSRISHDSFADEHSGFSGDSDNAMIKFFSKWNRNSFFIRLSFYIDEFQLDSWDREVNSDALLLNGIVKSEFTSFAGISIPWSIKASMSIANPNFGEHPGPFTAANSAGYPLFENTPGMMSLIFVETEFEPIVCNLISLSWQNEHWVNISSLPPELRNSRLAILNLEQHQDTQIKIELRHHSLKSRTTLHFQGWKSSVAGADYGGMISLIYNLSL
jgi:hypothetical protein